jgi:hypothetical protein
LLAGNGHVAGGQRAHGAAAAERCAARVLRPARRLDYRAIISQRTPAAAGRKGAPMNKKQWLAAIVLADFLALNAVVIWQYGYIGFFEAAMANLATVALMVDLVIAVSLIAVWMWNDAKARGISPLPYLLASLFLGSAGPLAYLVRTLGGRPAESAAPRIMTQAAAKSA